MRYANQTIVSVELSKAEIEHLLQRYGASEFAHGWKTDKAVIQFRMTMQRFIPRNWLGVKNKVSPKWAALLDQPTWVPQHQTNKQM